MTMPGHTQRRGSHPGLAGGNEPPGAPAEVARPELVEELAGVLAFNAALRDRFERRAVRLRELLRSGHLKPVEYDGEMTRMIRTLRLINDDLAARFDAFPPIDARAPAGSGVPATDAPVTETLTAPLSVATAGSRTDRFPVVLTHRSVEVRA
jgi:hypothetical protein